MKSTTASQAAKRSAAADAAAKRAAASARPAQATPPTTSTTTGPMTWNEFQRQQAGKGYSKRQISLLFKEHKAATAGSPAVPASTNAARATSRTTTSTTESAATAKPARRPNAFNEFQKQYKKDHPNEKRTTAELAKLYRQQQQQEIHTSHNERLVNELFAVDRGGFEDDEDYGGGAYGHAQGYNGGGDHVYNPEAFDEVKEQLVADTRHLIESMMLEMTKRMEELRQQSASTEEIEEAARVVQGLEAEEGNLNRKAFVDAHEFELALTMSKENHAVHSEYVSSLRHCEVIDASRLKIEMDDESRIGSGACGVVYTAMLDNDTPVAVKVVDGVNTKAKERFEQEMLAMMKASAHENVLRVLGYSVFTERNGRQSFGIVMELMSGGDLAYMMHRDETVAVTENGLLQILVQVIKAIEYIHSQGITHRDIKPRNVLLSGDRKTAKLADFGLAGFKNATMSTRQSQTGTSTGVMGLTPAYAAPEVIDGKLSFRDTAWKKSDIFSFTVLLTEAGMRGDGLSSSVTQHFLPETLSPVDLSERTLENSLGVTKPPRRTVCACC